MSTTYIYIHHLTWTRQVQYLHLFLCLRTYFNDVITTSTGNTYVIIDYTPYAALLSMCTSSCSSSSMSTPTATFPSFSLSFSSLLLDDDAVRLFIMHHHAHHLIRISTILFIHLFTSWCQFRRNTAILHKCSSILASL